MRSFFVASIIFLFFFFAGTVHGDWMPAYGTHEKGGCYDWKGRIRCEGSALILPTAKVEIWEEDDFWDPDDKVDSAQVNSDGTYSLRACVIDEILGLDVEMAQPYLIFTNACPNVERAFTIQTSPHYFYTYEIAKEGSRAKAVLRTFVKK